MNPKEILHADMLDIIFDNRNKTYGAYALRKHYNNRLFVATFTGLSVMLGISLFVHFSHPAGTTCIVEDITPKPEVHIAEIPRDKPVIPEARVIPQQPAASRAFNNSNIQIEKDAVTDIPTIDELDRFLVDNVDRTGPDPTPKADPVVAILPATTELEVKPAATELLQRQPEFPGGKAAWKKFLERHLTVPEELAFGERKTVQVKFLVSEDGSITQFVVVRSGGDAFDNEVIRVLKKMPKWSPAVQNGRNVAVTFTQPVTFQSVEE